MDNQEKTMQAYVKMRRESAKTKLWAFYVPLYTKLCALLEGTYWAPYSGYRGLNDQALLYAKGRTVPGRIVTNAAPGNSAHNWGCATDWAEFRPGYKGQDPWAKANWPEFAAAVKTAKMKWGGDFKELVDRPHCELPIEVSWSKVGDVYRAQGYEMAQILITKSYKPGGENV